jgi:putative PIN family toxin of toxin-antitoxin system
VRIVLDTNVFVSGVFFRGPPYEILKAWQDDRFQLVISQEILQEYREVGEALAKRFSGVDLSPILELLIVKAELTESPSLLEAVCDDPEDDKFLACALAGNSKLIISGDKHLLKISGYQGIKVIKPRKFFDDFL